MEDIELGNLLKQARKEKKLTLADIQERTKIRKKYLEAIENNDFEVLPGKVYLKVFVKAYAREVDINYQELLNYYEILNIENKKDNSLKDDYLEGNKISSNSKKKRTKNLLKIIFILGLILFLGAALVYTYQYFNESEIRSLNKEQIKENQSKEIDKIDKKNKLQEIDSNNNLEQSLEADLKDLDDSDQNIFNDNNLNLKEESKIEIIEENNFKQSDEIALELEEFEEETKNISFKSQSEKNNSDLKEEISEMIFSDKSNLKSENEDLNSANKVVSVEKEVILKAEDRVWLKVEVDNEISYSGILETGEEKKFIMTNKIYLKIGNATAVTALINGVKHGPWPGSNGISEIEIINKGDNINIENLRD